MLNAPPASQPRPESPPQSLINLETARQRFGAPQVESLIALSMVGDVLADAVIAETATLGSLAQVALHAWRTSGEWPDQATLPALHALLADLEPPAGLSWERIERGATAYRSAGVLWTMLALGPGSLVHTYLAPVPASILVRTGNLTSAARQRVIETGTWLIATLLPQGLRPGGAGVQHTLEVRLLHARIRATLLARGWDVGRFGLPLNQLEMTRTWLDFTVVPFAALARLGLPFTPAELDDLYALWHWIGHLLGVDPRLIAEVHDQARAQKLLELLDSTMLPPSTDSQQLTAAMLQAIADLAGPMLGRLSSQSYGLAVALARRIHGRRIAAQLGIPRTPMSLVLPLLVGLNRLQRNRARRNPAAWQQVCELATASFAEIAAREMPPTAYQQTAQALQHPDLPQVTEPVSPSAAITTLD